MRTNYYKDEDRKLVDEHLRHKNTFSPSSSSSSSKTNGTSFDEQLLAPPWGQDIAIKNWVTDHNNGLLQE